MKNQAEEAAARDEALDLLEQTRGELIDAARQVALRIAKEQGVVSSTEVFSELETTALKAKMDQVDPRWMGAVFRKGWERVGFESTGSHRRPVSVWRRKDWANLLAFWATIRFLEEWKRVLRV